jgi:hypothetical protein
MLVKAPEIFPVSQSITACTEFVEVKSPTIDLLLIYAGTIATNQFFLVF